MTTTEARAKLVKDIDELRSVDKLGSAEASAMAALLVEDSIRRLIEAAKADGALTEPGHA